MYNSWNQAAQMQFIFVWKTTQIQFSRMENPITEMKRTLIALKNSANNFQEIG